MRFYGKQCLHIILLLTLLLLGAGCTDDAPSAESDVQQALTFEVTEEAWKDKRVQITRSDATMLEGLKASNRGFGLYCSDPELNLTNQQVTWDGSNLKWSNGYTWLWPNNKSSEINLYAYAPYWDYTTYSDKTIEYSLNFAIDLMWASTVANKGVVELNFKHALGKLSFGTITNNYGRTITLTELKVTGTPYYSGKLSLVDGSWSDLSEYTESQTFDRSPSSPGLSIADGEAENMGVDDILLIPGSTVTITLTFTTADFGTEIVSFNTTLTTDTNTQTTLNITITNNFEVVIAP